VDFLDLGHRADVAGNDGIDFAMFLALQVENVAEFHGFLGVADDDVSAAGGLALVHAEDGQFADERVGGDFEDMGQQGFAGIFAIVERFLVRAIAGEEGTEVAFVGIGEVLDDGVEQFGNADAGLGIGEADGDDVAFIHGLFERRMECVVIRLFAAEIFLHQVLIHLDDLIEHGGVAAADGVEVGLAGIIEQAFDDGFAPA
jgi:hypothetical protein